MKKKEYSIATVDGAVKVSGYVFKYGVLRIGFDRRASGRWAATELKTGKLVHFGERSMKEEINHAFEILTNHYSAVKRTEELTEDLNPGIDYDYVRYTCRPRVAAFTEC